MGAFKCPTCIHRNVCKDELLSQPINKVCAHYIVEKGFTSANKQMVSALWRAMCHKDVKKPCNMKGVWLPLTKKRLNAAYVMVFGL